MARYDHNASGTSPGSGCSVKPQKSMPGPVNPGQPIAMKKALAKKSMPDKGTSSPGKRR